MKFLKCLTAVALVLLLSTCSGEHPPSSIDPRTDFAESIHSLYVMIFWITLAILVLVWAVMAYVLVRFRARPDTPLPRQINGYMGMEIAWTILPV
jgi:cytochrome c oxidase subunit 2